jgi:hypothetical protein
MDSTPHITDDLLLDYLLEQCDEQEKARVASALEGDPQVAARFGRLQATLAPLETWTTPPPPTSMVSDILDNIAAHDARAVLRGEEPGPAFSPPAPAEVGGGRGWIISLREVLALAACIAIFVGLLGPSVSMVRQSARRQMCASNLGMTGRAVANYAADHGGQLPYTGPRHGVWIRRQGQPLASNTRHMYPLLKARYLANPKVVICPGCPQDRPMSEEEIDRHSDFPDLRNRSYHLQHMDGSVRVRLITRPGTMPLLSDPNPVFAGESFNIDVDPETANSEAHRGRGQNVLHHDGHVGWYTTPVMASTGDNMWQIANLRYYYGVEAPTAATDVFMAP